MTVRAWISFAMGGAVLDPATGEVLLIQRLKAIGVDTRNSPYAWNAINEIIADILATPDDIKIAVGGDSLGANEAPAIAQAVRQKKGIDLLFGFQRSEYGTQVVVPANVIKAVNVYNPIWIATVGLGDDPWTLEDGNTRTVIRSIPIEAAHPGDFGVAQDIVYTYIKQLIGA
jgi:hypothetical protein